MAHGMPHDELYEKAAAQLQDYQEMITVSIEDIRNLRRQHEEMCVVLNMVNQMSQQDPNKVSVLAAVALARLAGEPDHAATSCGYY